MSASATTFQAIGVIHTPFAQMSGTPIQGVFAPDSAGPVEVFEEFAEGLRDVEQFSHLYLLYAFHRRERMALTCVPFLDDKSHGVFATRAPCRPNAIGLSIVRLLSRDGRRLRVAEVDIVDGTPLLDIKPYVPEFDAQVEVRTGWLEKTRKTVSSRKSDDRFK